MDAVTAVSIFLMCMTYASFLIPLVYYRMYGYASDEREISGEQADFF